MKPLENTKVILKTLYGIRKYFVQNVKTQKLSVLQSLPVSHLSNFPNFPKTSKYSDIKFFTYLQLVCAT